MIELTVQSVLDGGAQSVCVVTGRDAQKIEAALSLFDAKSSTGIGLEKPSNASLPRLFYMHNPQYATSDMLQSIKLGLAALLEEADLRDVQAPQALFIIPGDMPGVSFETFALMRAAWEEEREKYSIFVPTYQGRRGHPLLISSVCYGNVLDFGGEGGLRQALSGFDWYEVPTNDPGIRLDADTPADFDKLKAHLRTTHCL